MVGIVNPFATIGDYQNQRADHDELVTTGYLTGNPDPRQIADQQVALIIRTLMKRDTRTKSRALSELQLWIDGVSEGESIEDAVQLSYIQLYAKLSIDVEPLVRAQSHVVLERLYRKLGKKSSKYLKYSVGPWIAGTYDPDLRAATAATHALDTVFPGDKQAVLLVKFKPQILDLVYDSCVNASAKTLSDERYVTAQDATQKYTRLVKCCLDVLAKSQHMFDMENEAVRALIESGRIWKFFSSADSALARSAIKLASMHVAQFEPYADGIWKELLRTGRKNVGGQGVALDVVQLMSVLTKRYPSITWPADEHTRKDSIASIAQFVAAEPVHPARFWPLLYNLLLIIPEPPNRDLTPLYKPLEKVVLRIKHNVELEDSAWGCFVSLARVMGPSYTVRVFKAAEQRCAGSNVPVKTLVKFLSRVASMDGVAETVESQLSSDKTPLSYILILAEIRSFRNSLENLAIPRLGIDQLALVLVADPELPVPSNLEVSADPHWIDVAAVSKHVDSQHILEKLAALGLEHDILLRAKSFGDKNLHVSLDAYADNQLNHGSAHGSAGATTLGAIVGAESIFVSRDTAGRALNEMVQLALADEEHVTEVARVVKANHKFVDSLLAENVQLQHDIQALAAEDRQGILHKLGNLRVSTQQSKLSSSKEFLDSLDLEALDLTAPAEASLNLLRAVVPTTSKSNEEGVSYCLDIIDKVLLWLEESPTIEAADATKLLVLSEYLRSWEWVVANKDARLEFEAYHSQLQLLSLTPECEQIWRYTGSENKGLAYHAALAIAESRLGAPRGLRFSRDYFTNPSLRGALVAYFSLSQGENQYAAIQRTLVREALTLKLRPADWMLVDTSLISEASGVTITSSLWDQHQMTAVLAINTLGASVNQESLEKLLLRGPVPLPLQLAALRQLETVTHHAEFIQMALELPRECTKLDRALSQEYSRVILSSLDGLVDVEISTPVIIQGLLERSDSASLAWLSVSLARISRKLRLNPLLHEEEITPTTIASWAIFLNYLPKTDLDVTSLTDSDCRRILDWISSSFISLNETAYLDGPELITPPKLIGDDLRNAAGNLLYQMSIQYANAVREWYRDQRDKKVLKVFEKVISTRVIPEILRALKNDVGNSPGGLDDAEVTVNEKQREVRATREIEDELTVEIVISLPESYPAKPAQIEIKNLAGVSEAKKRGWLLEARHNVQSRGILAALGGLVARLNNFLDGVEPCAICYMTVNESNKLPNKECGQCHNIYHSECLYKWFSTNGNKLCPMCRAPL